MAIVTDAVDVCIDKETAEFFFQVVKDSYTKAIRDRALGPDERSLVLHKLSRLKSAMAWADEQEYRKANPIVIDDNF